MAPHRSDPASADRQMTTPILISNLTNIRYLSGVDMTAGVMLLTRDKRMLFVDDRYVEKAKTSAALRGRGVRVLHIEHLNRRVRRLKRVRFEADDLTVARLKRWRKRFRGTKLISSQGVIEALRRGKKPNELKAIAKACRITDGVFRYIPEILRMYVGAPRVAPGLCVGAPHGGARGKNSKHRRLWQAFLNTGAPVGRPYERYDGTEKNLARIIEQLSRSLGADAMAFETIVAFGSNTSRPHHHPTERKLRKGDIIQVDMGVKVDGYCSDCSRVFCTKMPTEEQKKIFDLLVRIVKETTKHAKAGVTNRSLDAFARTMLKKERIPTLTRTPTLDSFFLHGLGHGVGLEIHEGVSLSQRAPRQTLKQNEVITIEPGVYFEGKWGMRIENTVVIGKNGGKRLTKVRY